MLTFIIFGVVFVTFTLVTIFSKVYDKGFLLAISIVSGVVLLFLSLSLININKKFELEIEEYENLRYQVEEYNSMDEPIKVSSVEYDIREKVLEVNNRISRHKVMCKSVWVSPWYSEKVGSLEKLKLNAK